MDSNRIPVAISATVPDGVKCYHFKKLAPSYDNLMSYKSDKDWNKYSERYKKETLEKLKAIDVISEIKSMIGDEAKGKDIVLMCYEKNHKECHRSLVAEWLTDGGVYTKELQL